MTDKVDKKEEVEKEGGEDTPAQLSSFYGVKAGMTRIFNGEGNHIPVTVIKLIPNYISQVKTMEKDGYESYQVAYGEKTKRVSGKPAMGILYKAGINGCFTHFSELHPLGAVDEEHQGKLVQVDLKEGVHVDVTGKSKGKGFQGVMKKFGFKGGPKSHGSKFHRTGGSIGNRATPGRVWKNKKMPGRMGGDTCTVQNLKVMELNQQDGYLLVEGGVPGAKNDFVKIALSIKKEKQA